MVIEATETARTHRLLPTDDIEYLAKASEFRVGNRGEPHESRTFVIEVDARPLVQLIEAAAKGQRVYELLSIERPGEILHYVRVTIPDSSSSQAELVTQRCKQKSNFGSPMGNVCELGFIEFDDCLPLQGDDTEPAASMWRGYVNAEEWRQYPTRLMSLVRHAQAELRQWDDYLVQHEIALIAVGQHHLDFASKVQRVGEVRSEMAATDLVSRELFELIVKLVKQPDVHSVSCPFQDYGLWRELVAEQVRRSISLGVEPQKALRLNGPDSGVPFVSDCGKRPDLEWGGEIHIPYEGTCGGDLFIQPHWFGFMPDAARIAPTLSQAVFGLSGLAGFKTCNYLLTRWTKLGEIASAKRTEVGDWVLYEAKNDSQ